MADAPKRAVQINPTRMRLAEYDRQDWVCTAEFGTTVEDVLDPAYFAHMASQLKPYDHIEVRIDSGEWLLQLLVLEVARAWTRCVVLAKYNLDTNDVSQTVSAIMANRYKVEWKGPHLKWCAIRKSDNEILQKEMGSKRAAEDWLDSYERTITAPA